MKDMKTALAFMAAMLALASHAGLKYWTSGPYDADSYVQDGLVLNYDGIRNVGLNVDHSTTTTTWKNLGSGGATYDLRQSKLNLGEWGKDGFDFKGKTTYASTTAFTFGTSYTVQALIDAKTDDHGSGIGYVYFPWDSPSTYWKTFSIGVRGSGNSAGDRIRLNHYNYFASAADISGTSFSYVTALIDVTNAWFFTGIALGGKKDLASGKTLEPMTTSAWGIGGNPGSAATSAGQPLFGTIKSYRHYNRAISEEERTWNRAVDQTRFFGALPLSAIPVTNAVIASSMASVSGNEKAGAYAVDASGYTFSAPASKAVDGRSYTCTGYTLETWDDTTGTWGAVQTESGTSVTVTASDRVRITWQWTGGDGIVTRYTTADYVQDGLLLQYDGIRNVGVDQPHSSDTTIWKNIASAGGWDMAFHAKSGVTKPGEWRTDGYRFEQQSWFTPGASFTLPSNQTVQIAVEANGLDQEDYLNSSNARVNEPYLWYNTGTFDKGGSISLRRDNRDTGNEWFDWTTHGYSEATGNASTRPDVCQPNGTPLRYVTAVLGDDYTAAFIGTSIPTTTSANRYVTGAVRMALTSTPQVQTASGNGFYIGGLADNTLRKFRGTIHNFRFYNRVLTNEELAQNRVVDDYRFHGIMPVTNVVVATSHSFLSGNEANGNYEISGTYTFGAPTALQTDSRGFEYTFAGYMLETWDDTARGWSAPVSYESGSYTYTVGTSPAKVRLTWRWNCTKALRTAADYGLEDVVPNGLVLHYDGIKNIGAECADVTNPTNAWSKAWVNLADPHAYNLTRVDRTTRAGCWTDCGYAFTNTSSSVGGYFRYSGNFTFNPRYSLQVLVDAKVEDQVNATCGYLMFNDPWKAASMAIRTASDYNYAFYYVADNAYGGGDARPKITNASKTYSYATAIINGKSSTFFEGTEAPTSGSASQGYYAHATKAAVATNVVAIRIGGGQGAQDFTGTLKSFRYYDRVLTTDELVRNRNVDSSRYFGALATTNVFVEAGGGTQAETGAYKVEGSWTFTATTVTKKNGTVVPVERYSVETWANGAWTGKEWHAGASYTYTEGTNPAAVRLTWHGQPEGTAIVVR